MVFLIATSRHGVDPSAERLELFGVGAWGPDGRVAPDFGDQL
jgi:hypothetical protein